MEEIWKDIINFEGFYQISSFGNIKFLKRTVKFINGTVYQYKEKMNKFHKCKRGGYLITDLVVNKKRTTVYIHRLLAIHFLDNPLSLKYVNHKNKNVLNNQLSNLEWVSNRENICHSKIGSNSSSKYIGVGWDKYSKKWKSQIYFGGKSIHLGNFISEEDAYKARTNFELENNIKNKYL
jgi:hypothetical protein